jgi:hypothetical protein
MPALVHRWRQQRQRSMAHLAAARSPPHPTPSPSAATSRPKTHLAVTAMAPKCPPSAVSPDVVPPLCFGPRRRRRTPPATTSDAQTTFSPVPFLELPPHSLHLCFPSPSSTSGEPCGFFSSDVKLSRGIAHISGVPIATPSRGTPLASRYPLPHTDNITSPIVHVGVGWSVHPTSTSALYVVIAPRYG